MRTIIAALLLMAPYHNLANTGGGTKSPLTTKGDVWGYSSTDARIPVGSNNQVLTADSSQTLGLKWAAAQGLPVLGAPVTIAGSTTVSQGAATQITAPYTIVTGSNGNTVAKLPASPTVGQEYVIEISGAETQLVLYPQVGGSIDENGTNNFMLANTVSLNQINNARVRLIAESSTQWRTLSQQADIQSNVVNDTATTRRYSQQDFHGATNFFTQPVTLANGTILLDTSGSATVTAAGNSLGTCTALTGDFNNVTAGAASTGTCLPAAQFGAHYIVHNASGNAQVVYPKTSGGQINALGNGASMALPNAARLECWGTTTTQYYCTTMSDL